MSDFMTWIKDNQILSGVGVLIISGLGYMGKLLFKLISPNKKNEDKINIKKKTCRILFIDDSQFKVIDILKKAGWLNVKRLKDINNIDDAEVANSDIFFVDIQGVGKALNFSDEGLGLAQALKTKYPKKVVIIYSAENQGNRFHKALKSADATLSKNADPYEFQALVEQYCHGV